MMAASLQLPGFSAVSLTLSPSLAMVLAGCSVIAAAQFLHCYHISWDCRGHQTVPAAPISVPSHLYISSAHSDMPTFRCLHAWVSDTFVCWEGILCWIIFVQLDITLRGETKGSSHSAVMLMSLWGCNLSPLCTPGWTHTSFQISSKCSYSILFLDQHSESILFWLCKHYSQWSHFVN